MQNCGRACLLVSCRLVDRRLSRACALGWLTDDCHVYEHLTLPQNCQHTGVALRGLKLPLFVTAHVRLCSEQVAAADAHGNRSPTSCTAVLAWQAVSSGAPCCQRVTAQSPVGQLKTPVATST